MPTRKETTGTARSKGASRSKTSSAGGVKTAARAGSKRAKPAATQSRSLKNVPAENQRGGALIHERRLANGLKVLIAERHLDPVVAVLLYYKVGAVDEPDPVSGVSHFLEHMMFKGTPRFGKGSIDHTTAALGGQNNAFTGYDHTGYWYEFSSDRWEHALLLESDRMQHLALDPKEFGSEREVVLEELAMGEDEPWRVLARRVEARLFGRHPYGRPIIGFPDTLHALTPEAMRAHYRRFYSPSNATLLICGDVQPAAALRAVKQHFGAFPAVFHEPSTVPGKRVKAAKSAQASKAAKSTKASSAELTSRAIRPAAESPFGEQRLEMRWPDAARRLCIAWRGVPAGSPDDYALDLVVVLLTSGRNSRLQRSLVLDGALATSVSAYNDSRVEDGAFWLQAQLKDGISCAAFEAALDQEIARLSTEAPSEAELQRALRMLRASEAHESETISDLAEELGGWAVDVDWTHALDGGRRHAEVTPEALREAAARLLSKERRVIGWCLPREANHG